MKWLAVVALLAASGRSFAQSPDSIQRHLAKASSESHNSIPFPFSLLLPEGIRIGYDLRDYIASPAFGAFDSSMPAERVFDEIYFEAMARAHGDIASGLLAAAFGSFEHESIPFDFFGLELDLPLTSEDHARFLKRQSHLPAHLYRIPEEDRDKLQHFFSSAWLKSIVGMDWLVELAGRAVEVGEDLFLVGGFQDPRDIHANEDGLHFAIRASGTSDSCTDSDARPSVSLTPNPPVPMGNGNRH